MCMICLVFFILVAFLASVESFTSYIKEQPSRVEYRMVLSYSAAYLCPVGCGCGDWGSLKATEPMTVFVKMVWENICDRVYYHAASIHYKIEFCCNNGCTWPTTIVRWSWTVNYLCYGAQIWLHFDATTAATTASTYRWHSAVCQVFWSLNLQHDWKSQFSPPSHIVNSSAV